MAGPGVWTATVDITAMSGASSSVWNSYIGSEGNLQWLYDNRVTKIAEFVLGVVTASVTFSSIPGTYRHLVIQWMARGDVAATETDLYLQFNGDTAANYDSETYTFSGTTTASIGISERIATAGPRIGDVAGSTAVGSSASGGTIVIPNYAGTTFQKLATATCTIKRAASTGNLVTELDSEWWRSSAAINAALLKPGSGNFVAGSTFQCYGMA